MKTADASDKSSFVLGAISFVLENNYGEEYPDDLNNETYYDIVDANELDSLDKEDTYDADHATEWMERNPHGYYNSEKDYGTDADENPVEEGYDDKFDYKQHDKKFQFQLLDRMRQDCEYFLGNGNRQEKFLWAGNVDDQIKAMRDLQSRLNPEWLSKEDIDRYESQMKDGKKLDEATDKLEESEYANVDTNPFRLVRQGDGCIALQRKLPNGRIERAGLFDSDEKEEALNKLAEINGVKQIDESSIVDRYSKPLEKDVKPELKNDPSVQEMVKVVLDNWDNYNDGEKATLKSAIFNASLGECGQLKKLYKK